MISDHFFSFLSIMHMKCCAEFCFDHVLTVLRHYCACLHLKPHRSSHHILLNMRHLKSIIR